MNYIEIVQALKTDNPPANLVEELTKAFHATFPDLTTEQAKAMLTVVGVSCAMIVHPKRAAFKAEALAYNEAQTQDNNKINHLLVIVELMSLWSNFTHEMHSELIRQLVKRN